MPITKGEKQTNKCKPESEIDENVFMGLCKIQCTLEEICAVLRFDNKTIEKWCEKRYGKKFKEIYKELRSTGKVSLRRAQWKNAVEDNNTTMQIWLGKQYLDQKDQPINHEENQLDKVIEIIRATKPENADSAY